jgi:hypothetical protein
MSEPSRLDTGYIVGSVLSTGEVLALMQVDAQEPVFTRAFQRALRFDLPCEAKAVIAKLPRSQGVVPMRPRALRLSPTQQRMAQAMAVQHLGAAVLLSGQWAVGKARFRPCVGDALRRAGMLEPMRGAVGRQYVLAGRVP